MNSINGIEGYMLDKCIQKMYELINQKPIDKSKLEHILMNFEILINTCRNKEDPLFNDLLEEEI